MERGKLASELVTIITTLCRTHHPNLIPKVRLTSDPIEMVLSTWETPKTVIIPHYNIEIDFDLGEDSEIKYPIKN